MNQQIVDGFEVRCAIAQRHDAQFHVIVLTRPPGDGERDAREWKVPGGRAFPTRAEAERYGRYVLLGISKIMHSGEPFFTVV